MEFFTSLFGVVSSAVWWFGLLIGLVFLIFSAPWQISLPVLFLILVLVLIFLPPVQIISRSPDQKDQDQHMEPQGNDLLTYRGVQYTTSPAMFAVPEVSSTSDSHQGEIIGKYRGSILKFPTARG